MTTLHLRTPIGRSPLRLGFLLIALVLSCFGLWPAPSAFGVLPPPDGGYPGQNTAEGDGALFSLTIGENNTAIGFEALFNNTTGDQNTATGHRALFNNNTGLFNTANGDQALYSNINGNENTATGTLSLYSNTTGGFNTATGMQALEFNTAGSQNTATGTLALRYNRTGHNNTANGFGALEKNTSGRENTAIGVNALPLNTTGDSNTATGVLALYSNIDSNSNIALGFAAGSNLTTGDNNIDIGNAGISAESNTIRIGTQVAVTDVIGLTHPAHTAAFIAGIYQATVAKGLSVVVDSTGHLGTKGSSERFKEAIKPMDKASEAILALRPVIFHYKKELDPEGTPQFGLVAEDVEKVNPDLVARDDKGNIYTVRYEAVNAMLLNEFLKEHRKVAEQEASITQLKSTVAKQEAMNVQQQKGMERLAAHQQEQIEALAAGLQKVSAQLEVRNPALQTVANDQ